MKRHRRIGLAAFAGILVAVVAAVFAGCGDDSNEDSTATTAAASTSTTAAATTAAATSTPTAVPLKGDLTVFAASSLTDVFNATAKAFTAKYPGVNVTFNYASSSALSTQINEGAPADVFASANDAQMKVVTDAGHASNPKTFATNLPVVIVPANSTAVTAFADLAKPGLRLVLAGPDVPIGAYARQIFANAAKATGGPGADFSERVLANLKSDEANVRAVLTKVQLGEADAGVVYSTDAAIALKDVKIIEIPTAYNVIATYPIAAVKDSKHADAANAWVAFVLSSDGVAILKEFGFGQPR